MAAKESKIFSLRADRLPGLSPSRMHSKTIGGRFFTECRSGPAIGFQAPGLLRRLGNFAGNLGIQSRVVQWPGNDRQCDGSNGGARCGLSGEVTALRGRGDTDPEPEDYYYSDDGSDPHFTLRCRILHDASA